MPEQLHQWRNVTESKVSWVPLSLPAPQRVKM
jgi:hypothetical protein